MTPNPENLMKMTAYAHSSDDENSGVSNVNLVKMVDGLTETPGSRPEGLFRTISRARSKSESESSEESVSIKTVEDDAGSTSSQDHGPYAPLHDPIKPGDRVVIKNKYVGTCRYVGPIKERHKSRESFVGIELDQKMTRFGGVFGSKKYFDCEVGYGIMVTFKNVKKVTKVNSVDDCFSVPDMVELPAFTKTISSRKSLSRTTSSTGSDDTGFDAKSLNMYTNKGVRISPGYDAVKSFKKKSASMPRQTGDPFQKQGTMEILESFKTRQHEFRTLFSQVDFIIGRNQTTCLTY